MFFSILINDVVLFGVVSSSLEGSKERGYAAHFVKPTQTHVICDIELYIGHLID